MSFSPAARVRAPRVQLPGLPWATIRFGDGQQSSARLQTISVTGGLLRVLKPMNPGAIVEVFFPTDAGPVLGLAQLLTPRSSAPLGLQPFRFLILDRSESKKLNAAIATYLENETPTLDAHT